MAIKPAIAYVAPLLVQLKVNPASPHAAYYAALVETFITIVKDGTVVPTLLIAPTGGGPVTGTGSIT